MTLCQTEYKHAPSVRWLISHTASLSILGKYLRRTESGYYRFHSTNDEIENLMRLTEVNGENIWTPRPVCLPHILLQNVPGHPKP